MSFVTIHLQYFIKIFTLMSLAVSLSRSRCFFFFPVHHIISGLVLKWNSSHDSSLLLCWCHCATRTVNFSYHHLWNKHLFFNFTPYYLLREENCWMHRSTRVSAGRKTRAGEKITLFCVSPSWHQHVVCPLEPITILFIYLFIFFFFNLTTSCPRRKASLSNHWA